MNMRAMPAVKHALREARLPAVAACVIAYLAYHLVQGDYGLLAWVHLSNRLDALETEATNLTAQRGQLEHRVTLLRPDGLDPDMLDEQARAVLGYVNPYDVVIIRGPGR